MQYYKPRAFSARSRILLVVPGAGRNGDSYRDAWIDAAEEANVLVAALSYPEADYDFAAYHMGGVVEDLEIRNLPPGGAAAAVIRVRDEDISFNLNPRRDEWIFPDFDRIFGLITAATGSTQTTYDLFGHSAGAQILHRMVLFAPGSRADHIVAANSGFYTLADPDQPLPRKLKSPFRWSLQVVGCRARLSRAVRLARQLVTRRTTGSTQREVPFRHQIREVALGGRRARASQVCVLLVRHAANEFLRERIQHAPSAFNCRSLTSLRECCIQNRVLVSTASTIDSLDRIAASICARNQASHGVISSGPEEVCSSAA